MQPPLVSRVLIRTASWIVPRSERLDWHARWLAELMNWQLLAERGELVGGERWETLCHRALAEAVGGRFEGGVRLAQAVRSPYFVPAAMAVMLVLLALVSHGFAVTRSVFAIARDIRVRPWIGVGYDPRGDHVFKYVAPILLALATGLALLGMGSIALRGRGLRYWGFLALKAIGVLILVPLVWIEIGALVRSWIPATGWRIAAGVAMAFGLVVVMGRSAIWVIADQRRRCRACLRRLVFPVTVGSWASLFEPAATEMLCEDGHGAMALSDGEANGQDRWTELDESWRALFR
jgi:hypothetical protein